MTDRRINWGAPTSELVARLVEVAQGWVDGDPRAQWTADGLIAKIQDEAIAKIVEAENRSEPPNGLETAEDDRHGHFWCRTVEYRDTEAEAIADAWVVVDRARGVVVESAVEKVVALRKDVPW